MGDAYMQNHLFEERLAMLLQNGIVGTLPESLTTVCPRGEQVSKLKFHQSKAVLSFHAVENGHLNRWDFSATFHVRAMEGGTYSASGLECVQRVCHRCGLLVVEVSNYCLVL